jgi:hypothetical protein
MKPLRAPFLLSVAAVAVIAAATALRGKDPEPAVPYVAHEWGTFTSMQGSDGITLDGLQHEEEGLPDFVYSRSEVRTCPLREFGYKGLEVDVENVTKKMETPVIYVYADRPLHLRARVCFRNGLLTQWYPVSDLLGPPEKSPEEGPLDMASVETSSLEWGVDVLAKGEGLGEIPAVPADEPWAAQRIPDSNVVRTDARKAPRMGPQEHEKFIFYRGLGRFDLPLVAKTAEGARVTLHNRSKVSIRHVFLVHVRDGWARWTYAPEASPGAPLEMQCEMDAAASKNAMPVDRMIAELRPALEKVLVEEGLYPSEAEAMTKTWERSYFRTEGLRILYLVPREQVDRILPLALDPAPRELVRVLVGRLECVTPEEEAAVLAALRDYGASDGPARARAVAALNRLGRFLEPHLRRAMQLTHDPAVLASAKALLAKQHAEGGDDLRPAAVKKETKVESKKEK